MTHRIRRAEWKDRFQIRELYENVSRRSGGLARRPEEITEEFVECLLGTQPEEMLFLVLETEEGIVQGAIHAKGTKVEALQHVLGHLTVLIRPEMQKKGYGKKLFQTFLFEVRSSLPHIYRVELRARASNLTALGFYERLGFIREGTFRARILGPSGNLEDGVPMAWFNPDWPTQNPVSADLGNLQNDGDLVPENHTCEGIVLSSHRI